MTRLVLERTIIARLLRASDRRRLRDWTRGLRLAGVGAYLVGDHGRAFAAIERLVNRGMAVTIETVVCEANGRIDADYLSWVEVAYDDGTPLSVLVDALLDAHRRAQVASVAERLLEVARNPTADVDRGIAIGLATLRRMRGAA